MGIDELREIALDDAMISLGYERDAKHSDSRRNVYITDIGKISIQGSKFFNFSSNIGGGGAIDLTMHIKNCSFIKACEFLNKGKILLGYSEKKILKIKTPASPSSSIPALNDAKINIVIDYLVNDRKIPSDLVNSLINRNLIYANDYGSVVFLHTSFMPEYIATGATIRATKGDFKQTIGTKNEGLFWFGQNIKEAETVIFAESPVDIISYYCLKSGSSDNCYVSLSGLFFPSRLKEFLLGKKIILALDNPDFEKNMTAKEANLRLEKEIKLINSKVIRETPKLKDWNEDLKKHTRHHQ